MSQFSKAFVGHLPSSCLRCGKQQRRWLVLRRWQRIISTATADRIVIVGSINADLVLEVPRLPEAGETMSASKLSTFAGGKVA